MTAARRAAPEQRSQTPHGAAASPKCSAISTCRQRCELAERGDPVRARERLAPAPARGGAPIRSPASGGGGSSSTLIARPRSKPRRTRPACSSMPTRTRGSCSSVAELLGGRDGDAVHGARAEGAVQAAQRVRLGDVALGEAAERRGVAPPREEHAVARVAVAPGPADHLDVVLERAREVVEQDEPDVGLVDPHPERRRRDDDAHRAAEEGVLRRRPLVRLDPGVVVERRGRRGRGGAARASRTTRASGRRRSRGRPSRRAARAAPLAVLLGVDGVDGVAEVRPDDARAHDVEARGRARGRSRPRCRASRWR